jgi:hypothetical protein
MQSGRSELDFPRTPATVSASVTSLDEEIGVFMMMGLRLLGEGIREIYSNKDLGLRSKKNFRVS